MKRSILLITFFSVVYHYGGKSAEAQEILDPDTYRNVTELITSKGYPCEEHTVRTEDGYLLSMQRIPYGKNNNTEQGDKKVVLLIHGELGDGKTWFLNPPGQGLGYILPDAGYDVWIINCRGSTYSQKNVNYPVRSFEFWNWSLDEVAKYDVTATIDYVLNATGKESLQVIGYSRGNTVVFCLLSESPEYNNKVKLFSALAPVTYIDHMTSIVRYAIPFRAAIVAFVNGTTQGEFLPTNKALRIFIAGFCELQVEFCENVIFAVGGYDRKNLNETRVPLYSAQYISSTSVKILLHFAQLYKSKRFRHFDYGVKLNMELYNRPTPPDYDLSRITAPVALFASENDLIGNPIDVSRLRRDLKSQVYDYNDKEYNHLDFIWAKDVDTRIYKGPLLDLHSQY